MDGFIIFLMVVVGIAYLVASIIILLKFGEIAESKGYDKNKWIAAGFFLGVLIYILITALPDKKQRKLEQQRHAELLNNLDRVKADIQGHNKFTSTIGDSLPEL